MASNAPLQYQVQLDTAAAAAALRALNNQAGNLGGGKDPFASLSSSLSTAGKHLSAIHSQVRTLAAFEIGKSMFSGLESAAATMGRITSGALEMSTSFQRSQSNIRMVSTSLVDMKAAQEQLYAIAQKTQQPYANIAELYKTVNKTMVGMNRTDGVKQTEILSKLFAVDRQANPQGAEAAMTQFGQLLSGRMLQAEDLNSIREGAPTVATALVRGLREKGFKVNSLRDVNNLSVAGQITNLDVPGALATQSDFADKAFSGMPKTFSSALDTISNSAQQWIGRFDEESGISRTLSGIFTSISSQMDDSLKSADFHGAATSIGNRFREVAVSIAGWVDKSIADLKPLWDESAKNADKNAETIGSKLSKLREDAVGAMEKASGLFTVVKDGFSAVKTVVESVGSEAIEYGLVGTFLFGKKAGMVMAAIGYIKSSLPGGGQNVTGGPGSTTAVGDFMGVPSAANGAILGAAVGSVIPGVGTLLGAAGGAIGGGLAGLVSGNSEADTAKILEQLRASGSLSPEQIATLRNRAAVNGGVFPFGQGSGGKVQVTPDQVSEFLLKSGVNGNAGASPSASGSGSDPTQTFISGLTASVRAPVGGGLEARLAATLAEQQRALEANASTTLGILNDKGSLTAEAIDPNVTKQVQVSAASRGETQKLIDGALAPYFKAWSAERASEIKYAPELSAAREEGWRTEAHNRATALGPDSQVGPSQKKAAEEEYMATYRQQFELQGAMSQFEKRTGAQTSYTETARAIGIEREQMERLTAAYDAGGNAVEKATAAIDADNKVREIARYLPDAQADALRRQATAEEELKQKLEKTKEAAAAQKTAFESMGSSAGDALYNMVTGAESASKAFKSLGSSISKLAFDMLVTSPLKSIFSSIGTSFMGSSGLSASSQASGNSSLGGIGSSIGSWLGGGIKSVTDGLFGVGGKAAGGPVTGGDGYLVGEHGPELLFPGSSGSIVNAANTRSLLSGGGGNVTVNIQTPNPTAFTASRGQIASRLSEAVASGARNR